MTTQFELSLQLRNELGTNLSRRLRRDRNLVPVIVYGGEDKPQPLMIEHRILHKALDDEGFYTHILTLDIEGKKQKALLRAIHRHPFKPQILHADFQRVTGKEMLSLRIPLHFVGAEESPGVRLQSGIVEHMMVDIEVKCRADHIPEHIEVDLSKLDLNESIHLSQLKLPKGVVIPDLALGSSHDRPVVAVHPPQRVIEPVAEEAAAEAETEAKAETKTEGKTEG